MSVTFASESDLVRVVQGWLEERGNQCAAEVKPAKDQGVIDLAVIGRDGAVMAIECKRSMSLEVIAQAMRWKAWADYAVVAVPAPAGVPTEARLLAHRLCRAERIGVIQAQPLPAGGVEISWAVPLQRVKVPAGNRRKLLDAIHAAAAAAADKITDVAPGHAGGGRLTASRRTLHNLAQLVAAEPGIALKHAAGRIEHHWASDADARRRLTKLVQDLRVEGVEARMEAGLLTLWPVGGGQG